MLRFQLCTHFNILKYFLNFKWKVNLTQFLFVGGMVLERQTTENWFPIPNVLRLWVRDPRDLARIPRGRWRILVPCFQRLR